MNKFTEMVLIPKSEYEMLMQNAKPFESVNDTAIKQAQVKCDDILFSEDCPDDLKTAMYQSAMKSLLAKRQQVGKDAAEKRGADAKMIKTEMPLSIWGEKISQSVPQKFKTRARSLWAILSGSQSPISVSDNGEVEISGNPIPSSNIVDLISHAVRDSTSVSEPAGWGSFIDLLRQRRLNVPVSAVGKSVQKLISESTVAVEVGDAQHSVKGFGGESVWIRLNRKKCRLKKGN